MKYNIIYADPPWSFKNKNTGGSMISGADAKYPTLTISEIENLPIQDIAADDCILFMWWVGSQPVEALTVMAAWGFWIKTMTGFTWVKTTVHDKMDFGMGFWTRQGSENCLIATRGKPKRTSAAIRAVGLDDNFIYEEAAIATKERHSKKPDLFRNRIIDLMGDIPRIELFARQPTPGWDVWGNEVDGSIKLL